MSLLSRTGSRTGLRSGSPSDVDAQLAAGYRRCAEITREFGTTYYWGTVLLPPERRRHVYAVYALCRLADDIVDAPGATGDEQVAATAERLHAFAREFRRVADGGTTDDPVIAAVGHSVRTCDIPSECFDRFFGAMAQDLTQTTYGGWDDLLGYMDGSAAVIGEMMLPVLRPSSSEAVAPAQSLGLAFQLTNFLRDIGEDLGRGRVYVPQEDLRRFGADPWRREVTREWRELMRFEIDRNRELYRHADAGIAMLPPSSARCVATARTLYARILDRIEAADYDVFTARVRVPTWRKAAVSTRILVAGPPRTKGIAS
ncbi:phytoene synthase [Terracoccus luteus]|uniref:Phytoene synthase n=1 Tax=Terracoccus luteus TaxID=53356 RepID=A0A495XVU2_9MICO|nr:phytoene/squalene synthase family protein [Terracoccus luteus]RKT76856.1 phytoene synthase [Terracoccus luteus]